MKIPLKDKGFFGNLLIIWAVQVALNAGFQLYAAFHFNNFVNFFTPWSALTMIMGGWLFVLIGAAMASITEEGFLVAVLVVQCLFNFSTVSGRMENLNKQVNTMSRSH
jgi:hypothetical protein